MLRLILIGFVILMIIGGIISFYEFVVDNPVKGGSIIVGIILFIVVWIRHSFLNAVMKTVIFAVVIVIVFFALKFLEGFYNEMKRMQEERKRQKEIERLNRLERERKEEELRKLYMTPINRNNNIQLRRKLYFIFNDYEIPKINFDSKNICNIHSYETPEELIQCVQDDVIEHMAEYEKKNEILSEYGKQYVQVINNMIRKLENENLLQANSKTFYKERLIQVETDFSKYFKNFQWSLNLNNLEVIPKKVKLLDLNDRTFTGSARTKTRYKLSKMDEIKIQVLIEGQFRKCEETIDNTFRGMLRDIQKNM